MSKFPLLLTFLTVIGLASCNPHGQGNTADRAQGEDCKDLKKFYDQYHVQGCFVVLDQNKNFYTRYNPELCQQQHLPASTFKICNSLIGLETGVIKDEHTILPWDRVIRKNPKWNKDCDMEEAFHNSTLWFYQQLAKKIGKEKMALWVRQANYGNADITGAIDSFWLKGALRISPDQQVDFLKRLNLNQLPFSQRSMDIVKEMMIRKDTSGYVLRAKTGWCMPDNKDLGWYVGYIEIRGNVYYFANCIQAQDTTNPEFGKARTEIAEHILKELKIIP